MRQIVYVASNEPAEGGNRTLAFSDDEGTLLPVAGSAHPAGIAIYRPAPAPA